MTLDESVLIPVTLVAIEEEPPVTDVSALETVVEFAVDAKPVENTLEAAAPTLPTAPERVPDTVPEILVERVERFDERDVIEEISVAERTESNEAAVTLEKASVMEPRAVVICP